MRRHFVRDMEWCSEWDPDDSIVHYYPPQISRRKPAWIEDGGIPASQLGLLNEIYEALHNDSPRLAAMGVRSLIENVMIEKVGDQGGFGKNLQEFLDRGWISMKKEEVLSKIIEAGHAATHRNFEPSTDDLNTLMDIAESLLADVYVHPQRGVTLGGKIPPRPAKR